MGRTNMKLRRPFIWEDEMMEVRELFRRVDRVRKSGFVGFSTWGTPPPSSHVLSRNRMRRRRALCSVELSHLNYRETPYESLNHLQNIRGMCSRIQRQECPVERKKKDVDLESRPPLLRRPITSVNVESRGRKRPPFEVGRPYSAPISSIRNSSSCSVRDIGPTPLQYAARKLTSLYDITRKSSCPLRVSSRKSFNTMSPTFNESPASSKNSIPTKRPSNMSQEQLKSFEREMVDLDQRNSHEEVPSILNYELYSSDHQPCTKPAKKQQEFTFQSNNIRSNTVDTLQPTCIASPKLTAANCCTPSANSRGDDVIEGAHVEPKLEPFAYCGWSASGEVTTSSDMNFSISTINSKSQGSDLSSSNFQDYGNVSHPCDYKGLEYEKPSFIRPISDYDDFSKEANANKTKSLSRPKYNSRRLSPSKQTTTPLIPKAIFNNNSKPLASEWDVSSHETSTTPHENNNDVEMQRSTPSMRGGYDPPTNPLNLCNVSKWKIPPKMEDDHYTKTPPWHSCKESNGSVIQGLENITFATERTTIGLNRSTPRCGKSNPPRTVLCENNVGLVNQTNTVNTTTESRWLTSTPRKTQLAPSAIAPLHQNHGEMIGNGNGNGTQYSSREDEFHLRPEEGSLIANEILAEDPKVLIKHSSDPYTDFRMSMVTSIEEEGLQNCHAEVEDLFQFYLDLNPKIHHQVLHKVIDDIRCEYNFTQNSLL